MFGHDTFKALLVGLLIGLALFAYTGYAAYKSTVAQSWSKTGGTISESRTKRTRSRSYRRGRRRYSNRTTAVIKYKYYVGGKSYEKDRLSFGGFNFFSVNFGKDFRTGFYKSLEKYPKGKSVVVYYNPNQPGDSVLETQLQPVFFLLLLAAGALTGFCVWGLLPDDGPSAVSLAAHAEQFPSPA